MTGGLFRNGHNRGTYIVALISDMKTSPSLAEGMFFLQRSGGSRPAHVLNQAGPLYISI